jgi:hypothetical protein
MSRRTNRAQRERHGPHRSPLVALVLVNLIGLACAVSPAGTPPTPTPIAHPSEHDALVLRIETSGGLLPPFVLVTELPELSVYGDGTVIVLGPQILIYPPPALPNLLQSRITEDGLQLLLREAAAAGLLDGDADYPLPGVYDAPTTFFTVNAGGKRTRVSVYALGLEDPSDPRLTAEQREARQKLAAFAAKARDLTSWLPADAIIERDMPYVITRLQVVVVPADAPQAPQSPENIPVSSRPWSLPTPLSQIGEPAPWVGPTARCAVIASRKELPRLLEELATANTLTRWESGQQEFVLLVRPLLPDETGCQPRRW